MRGFIFIALFFSLSCVSKSLPPTEEMAITYALLEDARIGRGETYAPELMREARFFYEQAEAELSAGNPDRAEEFRQISEIRAKTVISVGRRKLYEREIEKLRPELIEANSTKKTHEEELRENVLKLEQIKDRLAISRDLMYSKALDMLEKVRRKIEAAESVSAEYFSPQLFREAEQTYKAAEESLNLGQNERSMELAEKAITFAERAYDESQTRYDRRNKITERISSIYGAQAEAVERGVRVVFPGLFAPSGTDILFDFYPSLDALADVLAEYPGLPVSIFGYTNDLKSEDDNFKLSQTRAEVVKGYLVSKGLHAGRFSAAGLGVDKALGSRVIDRRIELTIELISSENI